jgi:hypothetical protein
MKEFIMMNKITHFILCLVIILCLTACEPPPYDDGTERKYKITHGCGDDADIYYLEHGEFYNSHGNGNGFVKIYNNMDYGWDDTHLFGQLKIEILKQGDWE